MEPDKGIEEIAQRYNKVNIDYLKKSYEICVCTYCKIYINEINKVCIRYSILSHPVSMQRS